VKPNLIKKKHLCDPFIINPAHHGFNSDESGKKLTRIEIYKKISTQLGPNP